MAENSWFIVSLFSVVNDFSNWYDDVYGQLHEKANKNPTREPGLAECAIMTILLLFFQSHQKFFKHFYNNFKAYNKKFFPNMPCYERFMELRKRVLGKLAIFLRLLLGINTNDVDATPIKVCHRKRRKQYKTLKPCTIYACSTMGKMFGLKLHITADCLGNVCDFKFTQGSLYDRKALEDLLRNFTGIVFGDKGYISKHLKELLINNSINLVTRVKTNIKP